MRINTRSFLFSLFMASFFSVGATAQEHDHAGAQQNTLAALRGASDTSYYKDGDTLWVKLVVDASNTDGPVVERVGNHRAQVNLDVSR